MSRAATSVRRLWHPGDPVEPLVALRSRGGVLAFPTESSFGLGADPKSWPGVLAVERIKRRIDRESDAISPRRKPMPVVIADLAQLAELGIDAGSASVARVAPFWPAPLSVVLPLERGADLPAAGGTGSLAVRIPDHDGLRALVAAVGPLTATSANRTGEPPLLSAREVEALLREGTEADDIDFVVVDGEAPGGLPSTLVAFEGDEVRVLRQGPFPAERLLGRDGSSFARRGEV